MANSPEPHLLERYQAVEQAYGRGDYRAALNDAELLLPELSGNPNTDLRQRLLLLIGHLQLHGLGERELAAHAYSRVLEQGADAVLSALARDGLRQCQPSDGQAATTAATPWAAELKQPPSLLAPVPEPEPMPSLRGQQPAPAPPPAPSVQSEASAPQELEELEELSRGLLLVRLSADGS